MTIIIRPTESLLTVMCRPQNRYRDTAVSTITSQRKRFWCISELQTVQKWQHNTVIIYCSKLPTAVCLGTITWYQSKGGDALRLGRWPTQLPRPTDLLAVYTHLRAQRSMRGKWAPCLRPHLGMTPRPLPLMGSNVLRRPIVQWRAGHHRRWWGPSPTPEPKGR